jgi:hypothetical protein
MKVYKGERTEKKKIQRRVGKPVLEYESDGKKKSYGMKWMIF